MEGEALLHFSSPHLVREHFVKVINDTEYLYIKPKIFYKQSLLRNESPIPKIRFLIEDLDEGKELIRGEEYYDIGSIKFRGTYDVKTGLRHGFGVLYLHCLKHYNTLPISTFIKNPKAALCIGETVFCEGNYNQGNMHGKFYFPTSPHISSKFFVYKKEELTAKKDNLYKITYLRDTKELFYQNDELRDTFVRQEFFDNEMIGKFEMQRVFYRDPGVI